MEITPSNQKPAPQFNYWFDPTIASIGKSGLEFLHLLTGPTHLHLSGRDRSRCRAIVTLLHGNEPSGLYAIFELLRQQIKPAVDIHFFIPSVEAAQAPPGFFYRMLPAHKDLNRCFRAPFDNSGQDQLAALLLSRLQALKPEAVIDVHNTSGSGPSFGVTTFLDDRHEALVSFFTHRMIVTDMRLGALMEISDSLMPTVTIECGGAQEKESNLMAYEGIQKYVEADNVLSAAHNDFPLEFFHNPIRLETRPDIRIGFSEQTHPEYDITLLPDLDNHNFGHVEESTLLGFVKGDLADYFTARDSQGEDRLAEFFHTVNGEFRPTRRLKLFMITTNPVIANQDCLFYMVAT